MALDSWSSRLGARNVRLPVRSVVHCRSRVRRRAHPRHKADALLHLAPDDTTMNRRAEVEF